MSNIKIITGNIFTSNCQTIVNTVNCVGIMGAGIALECRLRYPEMYKQYTQLCDQREIDIGKLWIYKSTDRWILNFPTKKHWKYPTKEQYLHEGLQKFISTYELKKIHSIAFPLLGAQNGGIESSRSLQIMESYLSKCNIPVEIYLYDKNAYDDVYEKFKSYFLASSNDELKQATNISINIINLIKQSLNDQNIHQLNQLASVKGIGDKTLEKCFSFMLSQNPNQHPIQHQLI